jgi:dTDP-glucose 4,6-dehydratase
MAQNLRVLITGGAGFIGSCFVRGSSEMERFSRIINVDKLTYAGNLENVQPVAADPRYVFVRADITDEAAMNRVFAAERPGLVVHFAAESHVDRSILSPAAAIDTNLRGTFTLLEAARRHQVSRFIHISTDEVYGDIAPPHEANEDYPLRPSSPYSASKAGSDLLALSYHRTWGLPVTVTRASNNYGPYQFPEKLIPLMISNAIEGKPLPLYGDGLQVRDWLHVEDHCRAIFSVIEKGRPGQIYNIGGNRSLTNREVVERILAATGRSSDLIAHVTDRPGHDRRYALSSAKLERETGWKPRVSFEEGLARTVAWYRDNSAWVDRVKSGEYRNWYERNYGAREAVRR